MKKVFATAVVLIAVMVGLVVLFGHAAEQEAYTTEQTYSATPANLELEPNSIIQIDLSDNTFRFSVVAKDGSGNIIKIVHPDTGILVNSYEIENATAASVATKMVEAGSANGALELQRLKKALIKLAKADL